jgi:DNA-binding protein HU-beta
VIASLAISTGFVSINPLIKGCIIIMAIGKKDTNMNKAMLVEQMAKMTKESKATCKRCLESFMDIVGGAMRKKQPVVLTGFGTFQVMNRKARKGVNPATGRKMDIPAKRVPKFKAGKALKDLVA